MDVKVVFSLDGNDDASMLASLLDILSKGKLSSKKEEVFSEPISTKKVETKVATPVKEEPVKESKIEVAKEEIKEAVEAKIETIAEEVHHASLEDIRVIARKLADSNRQKEYKPILEKYGYAKVNLINAKDYDVIYDEMKKLVGDENA